MVAQLVHVWVVLGHDGDGVTLLADDEASLLLRSVPQVDTIILIKEETKCGYVKFRGEGVIEERRDVNSICAQCLLVVLIH